MFKNTTLISQALNKLLGKWNRYMRSEGREQQESSKGRDETLTRVKSWTTE